MKQRFDAIDFWRGLVLCTIFVDHMPGNIFERVTPRNYGFSDAAEAFVFLSGVSIALAYGGRFAGAERLRGARGLARRALKLYAAHVGLSVAALAIFFVGAAWAAKPELLTVHGRELFVEHPAAGVLGLVSLGHQLGYFNILPLYLVLMLFAPALLLLCAIETRWMLAFSVAVFLMARAFGLNLPNWPDAGGWFFNPFAWQLLFAIGIAVGHHLRQGVLPKVSWPLLALATATVAVAAFVVTDAGGAAPGAMSALRARLDLDKSQLGVLRLAHFLALAYLIYSLRLTALLRRVPIYAPLALLGRHSLQVFVMLSIASALWQVVSEATQTSFALDAAFAAIGLAIIFAAVRLGERWPELLGRAENRLAGLRFDRLARERGR